MCFGITNRVLLKEEEEEAEDTKMIRMKFRHTSQMPLATAGAAGAAADTSCCSRTHNECSICYGRINNNMYVCTEPCNKLFHSECLEKIMDQQEDDFYANHDMAEILTKNLKPQIRCAYCRREINADAFILDNTFRELLHLRAGGYNVSEALSKVVNARGKMGDEETFDIEYFINLDCSYSKRPKQSFRASYKKSQPKKQRPTLFYKRFITSRR